ncbi:MAG: trehalase family glycosidase [Lentisphaeria bacterium]
MDTLLFKPTSRPFPAEALPEAVYDDDPRFVELWHDAWRLAWKHVYESEHMPCSPYLGEGCGINRIWLWDSCFMTLFTRYSNSLFPAGNTLDNFYRVISGECDSPILVHHPDNPPLFAWAELELYQQTGNLNRLEKLMSSGVLEQHYHWLEHTASPGECVAWGAIHVNWKHLPEGYMWSGMPSGMDNTPRGRGYYDSIMWVDALAQQGLFAQGIAELARLTGREELREKFQREYEAKKQLMQRYFDSRDQCFYDRRIPCRVAGEAFFCRVLTPVSFWPLLAGMATPEQARAMVETLLDPTKLGGPIACPSIARDDPQFVPSGEYWRGSVWVPVFYMTMKALEQYGFYDLAEKLSIQLLDWMKRCYDDVSPHTIWECYSPTEPLPADNKWKKTVRPDFCGWSALGPVSLFLENVIGLYKMSAVEQIVHWRLPACCKLRGVRKLQLGVNRISLLADSDSVSVTSSQPFMLVLNGKEHYLHGGQQILKRPRSI